MDTGCSAAKCCHYLYFPIGNRTLITVSNISPFPSDVTVWPTGNHNILKVIQFSHTHLHVLCNIITAVNINICYTSTMQPPAVWAYQRNRAGKVDMLNAVRSPSP